MAHEFNRVERRNVLIYKAFAVGVVRGAANLICVVAMGRRRLRCS